MAEIKSKVELKEKGAVASLGREVSQIVATMKWHNDSTDTTNKEADLDLMVFGKKKDGSTFGVFTDNLGGSLGELNNFPFIQLSGDEGVGAGNGSHSEEVIITKIDATVAELYLVALNYTEAAAKNAEAKFSNYDLHLELLSESGAIDVAVNSTENGTAVVIAKIDNSGIMANLTCENTVYDLAGLVQNVPGADALTK